MLTFNYTEDVTSCTGTLVCTFQTVSITDAAAYLNDGGNLTFLQGGLPRYVVSSGPVLTDTLGILISGISVTADSSSKSATLAFTTTLFDSSFTGEWYCEGSGAATLTTGNAASEDKNISVVDTENNCQGL